MKLSDPRTMAVVAVAVFSVLMVWRGEMTGKAGRAVVTGLAFLVLVAGMRPLWSGRGGPGPPGGPKT